MKTQKDAKTGRTITEWELCTGVCETDGADPVTVYGVRARCGAWTWEFADVDVSAPAVETLLARLRQMQPEPCHCEEIVRDYIEELAGTVG